MKISSSTVCFVSAGVLASQVAASNIWERTYNSLEVLVPRQSSSSSGIDPSDIPTQCQSQCTTVLNTISACTTDSCICTTDNANEMESCVNCLVALDPTSEMIEEGNEILDSLSIECDTVSGFPTLSVSASTTISDGVSTISTLNTGSSQATTQHSVTGSTAKGASTGTSTATSSAESESTSGSEIKGLNGALSLYSYKVSVATAAVGVLGFAAGATLLGF